MQITDKDEQEKNIVGINILHWKACISLLVSVACQQITLPYLDWPDTWFIWSGPVCRSAVHLIHISVNEWWLDTWNWAPCVCFLTGTFRDDGGRQRLRQLSVHRKHNQPPGFGVSVTLQVADGPHLTQFTPTKHTTFPRLWEHFWTCWGKGWTWAHR